MSTIKLAGEKNVMTLVVRGNTLKRRSQEAKKLQETVVLLKEKSQKMG